MGQWSNVQMKSSRSGRHPQTGRTGAAGTRKDHRVYPVAAAARQTSRDSRGSTPWLLPSPRLPVSWKPGAWDTQRVLPSHTQTAGRIRTAPRSNSHQPPALFYNSTCAEHTLTQSINKAGDTSFESIPGPRLPMATNAILRPTKMHFSSPRTRNLALQCIVCSRKQPRGPPTHSQSRGQMRLFPCLPIPTPPKTAPGFPNFEAGQTPQVHGQQPEDHGAPLSCESLGGLQAEVGGSHSLQTPGMPSAQCVGSGLHPVLSLRESGFHSN